MICKESEAGEETIVLFYLSLRRNKFLPFGASATPENGVKEVPEVLFFISKQGCVFSEASQPVWMKSNLSTRPLPFVQGWQTNSLSWMFQPYCRYIDEIKGRHLAGVALFPRCSRAAPLGFCCPQQTPLCVSLLEPSQTVWIYHAELLRLLFSC